MIAQRCAACGAVPWHPHGRDRRPRITYAIDTELAAAIADQEHRMAVASTDGKRQRNDCTAPSPQVAIGRMIATQGPRTAGLNETHVDHHQSD